jgi:preprotein translocase subunit SecY
LIFAGIVSALPQGLVQFYSTMGTMDPITVVAIVAVGLALLVLVTVVNEGTRNIPIEYGRRSGTGIPSESYLPIKINQTGMIPIIFAVAIASIPSFLGPLLNASDVSFLNQIGNVLTTYFAQTSWLYIGMYFLLVFGFTYFYTFFQFDPVKIADDVKKRGGFISGVRPGKNTETYLRGIIVKLTFFGALFLGSVAILPSLLQKQFGISESFVIGGSSLLIVVSVVLEIIRQVQSLSVSRSYDKYL